MVYQKIGDIYKQKSKNRSNVRPDVGLSRRLRAGCSGFPLSWTADNPSWQTALTATVQTFPVAGENVAIHHARTGHPVIAVVSLVCVDDFQDAAWVASGRCLNSH
jgi:hypothetical protein